jgi:protein-tyrosine phosphatase
MPVGPLPEYGLYLLGRQPPAVAWECRWLRWRDWSLPSHPAEAHAAFVELWRRAEHERVEVACAGGSGRTGTALACVVILDGLPAGDAVGYVRAHYSPRAVETPWQRRYVLNFGR